MSHFQKVFIENESKQHELAAAAEKAAKEAGYQITVKQDGSFFYRNEESYNNQEKIYSAVNEAIAQVI